VKAKPPALAGAAINELVFPIGCAVVIYLATYASRHLSVIHPGVPHTSDPAPDVGVPPA
jgi:hypothetical protein